LTVVVVELRTVVVHSFASASFNLSLSMSSLVTQCFSVVVFVCVVDFAFILSSILARCSGVSRFSISAGIGISPALLIVRVLSQRPGLTFRGCSLAAVCESEDVCISFADLWVCAQETGSELPTIASVLATTTNLLVIDFILGLLRRFPKLASRMFDFGFSVPCGQNASVKKKAQRKCGLNLPDTTKHSQ
jgi:hypothetical protein